MLSLQLPLLISKPLHVLLLSHPLLIGLTLTLPHRKLLWRRHSPPPAILTCTTLNPFTPMLSHVLKINRGLYWLNRVPLTLHFCMRTHDHVGRHLYRLDTVFSFGLGLIGALGLNRVH